ncbi:dihydrofolate reductase [Leifsonia sp. Root112D2]|uniref:dihydrofolate reductase n=1 Tax=Leifsonia sp. Root112D2 TaxID=1736426 RepID=UPI0006FE645B|nr:dihydrofolate reductase [Leifsonia sp. Root112D2]KQV07965.1 dihydrofolate reductase [Leifsonia sp. Root112D2]
MSGLIWAQTTNGVIGRDGGMPWHLPEDLAHFTQVTAGATVVMGRRTWDSLSPRFRPLPGRRNVVVSRQPGWQAQGAEAVASVEQALAVDDDNIWVIGGAQLYAATIALADRLEVTDIDLDVNGDTMAPVIGAEWAVTAAQPTNGWIESRTGLRYRFTSYVRA